MLATRKLIIFCSILITVMAIAFMIGKTIGIPPYVTFEKHNIEKKPIGNNKHIEKLDTHGISQQH